MAAKIANRSTSSTVQSIPAERRWTVVGEDGQAIYMASEAGITESDAERISASLAAKTRVVPEAALDRFRKLDMARLDDALAAARAEED